MLALALIMTINLYSAYNVFYIISTNKKQFLI